MLDFKSKHPLLMTVFTALLLGLISLADSSRLPPEGVKMSSSVHLVSRIQRATDVIDETLLKVQQIARLTNSIYLQNGLINGTVNSEKLIAELLRMGPITPSKIQSLDLAKIETPLNELKGLQGKLATGNSLDELESYFTDIKRLRDLVNGIEDLKVWPEKDDYTKDLENIVAGNVSFIELIKELDGYFDEWQLIYKFVLKDKSATDLVRLVNTSRNILDSSLGNDIPVLLSFHNNMKPSESIQFLESVTKAVSLIDKTTFTPPTKGQADLKTKLDDIQSVVSSVNGIKQDLDDIKTIFKFRSLPVNSQSFASTQYTDGLPDGFKDINRMITDFANDWVKKTVKDQRLKDSFKSMRTLESSVNLVEQTLGSKSDEHSEAVSSLLDFTKNLIEAFQSYKVDSANEVVECYKRPSADSKDQNVQTLIQNAHSIDTELENIHKVLVELQTEFNQNDVRGNIQKLLDSSNKMDSSQPESIKTAFDVFSTVEESLNNFTSNGHEKLDAVNVAVITSLASNSISLIAEVDKWMTQVDDQMKYLKCLIEKDAATKSTISVVENLKILRADKTYQATIDKSIRAAKSVIASKEHLKTAVKTIKSINGTKGLESDLLKHLKNAEEHSKVIGQSTRAVLNMKSVSGLKDKISKIKTHSKMISDETKKNKRSLENEDVVILNGVSSFGTSLDKMLTELTVWIDEVKKMVFSGLGSFSELFQKAKNVHGLTQDLGKMSESVDRLAKLQVANSKNQKDLDEVTDALDSLNGFGIRFDEYGSFYDKVNKSLVAVELFFSSFSRMIIEATKPINPRISSQYDKSELARFEEMIAAEKRRNDMGYVYATLLIVVAVVVFFLYLYSLYRYTMKPKIILEFVKFKPIKCERAKKILFVEHITSTVRSYKNNPLNQILRTGKEKDDAWPKGNSWEYFTQVYQSMYSMIDVDEKGTATDADAKLLEKHSAETRYPEIELAMGTRVICPTDKSSLIHFANDFIHASLIKLKNCFRMILSQGPVVGVEDKIDNAEKYWSMVRQYGSEAIVMLCDFFEEEEDIDKETGERGPKRKEKCSRYFPVSKEEVMTFGGFKIRLVEETYDKKLMLRIRKLAYSYNGEEERFVTHYHYLGWPDKGIPVDPTAVIMIWKAIRNSPNPPVIHCSAGIGRTGTFAFLESIYQAIYFSNGTVDLGEELRKLREGRHRAVQTRAQFVFAIVTVLTFIFEDEDIEKLPEEVKEVYHYLQDSWPMILAKLNHDAWIIKEDQLVEKETKWKNDKDAKEMENAQK
uniref:WSN domain-containing protein n=1 Tax=Caenorhabditis tropicalis TaxID=1561998 RepID=A0A1I7V2J5_9PELO